ncbi:MAG: endonuclease domain-containing protein [Candidatus Brocadiales bacterium]|nr:endonuclease domain-containing protein [Candidatus Brocadiales bacterium]
MKRKNIGKCRFLRKNQTDAESKLWSLLRNRQLAKVKFRRQFPIDRYILDFYSPEYKLGIEADGGQHYSDQGKIDDELRTGKLNEHGIQILRFSNLDILNNIEGVYVVIIKAVEEILSEKHLKTYITSPSKEPFLFSSPLRGEG